MCLPNFNLSCEFIAARAAGFVYYAVVGFIVGVKFV